MTREAKIFREGILRITASSYSDWIYSLIQASSKENISGCEMEKK
jgi:hypothetical protein